jgi:predicted nuclease of predicted toxin-antitoxin system
MLRLLLDAHISPHVARELRARISGIYIASLQEWNDGAYLDAEDAVILEAAYREHVTLVTYDQRTIMPLLRVWAEQEIAHGGVIVIDERTIAQNNIGGLVRALAHLWEAEHQTDWTNQVVYLPMSQE